MEYIETIFKGTITGILCAYLILVGLRPAVPYPEFILELFENLWIFMILLIVNYYVFIWDYTIGTILLLSILALIFDYVVFTNKGFAKRVKLEMQDNFMDFFKPEPIQFIETPKNTEKVDSTFYDVLIKDIKSLNYAYPGGPAPVK